MTDSPSLNSFGEDLNVAVIGASGGIGRAMVASLARQASVKRVFALSRRDDEAVDPKVTSLPIDITIENSIEMAAHAISAEVPSLDLVFVSTGLLHDGEQLKPEKSWRALNLDALETAFRVNAGGPALVGKHFLPLLHKERKAVFAALSARVGSIEDNQLGGWHSYRASKAALNMLIRTLAIELTHRNPSAICVGLHPGTVDTCLSAPFKRGVPADKLFSPAQATGHLLGVLDGLKPEDSGNQFAWDGSRVPA
ncbi:MAG: SDR family NAD(P)-dependent oxidoreductase [Proteobacteria bacterium]|nr:SDR family NAD(P)-dependent oxidoreductase [Pseudomonadota bacterium]